MAIVTETCHSSLSLSLKHTIPFSLSVLDIAVEVTL